MTSDVAIYDLYVAFPEIALALLALFAQLLGVMKCIKEEWVCKFTVLGLIAIALYMFSNSAEDLVFNGTYLVDIYNARYKAIVLVSAILVMLTYIGYSKSNKIEFQTEYVVLMTLLVLGGFIVISARDLMVLFVGIELQALVSYIITAFDRNNIKSSEAGVKYFILGALSSCIMLFGMSLLYGLSGSTLYTEIYKMSSMVQDNIGLMFGVILLISGLMFKFSIAPFHAWTPDVYEGAPSISVSFLGSTAKIPMLIVLVNILMFITIYNHNIQLVLQICAILSMCVGSVGAVMQTSFKRLIGYSTILNMGYVLVPISSDIMTWHIGFLYLVIYAATTIGIFAILPIVLGARSDDCLISDLDGLSRTKKIAALVISIFMFSMIGLPPFAGFFGKYMVIYTAFMKEEYIMVFFMVISSVIAAYYYLRVIKAMYFGEVSQSNISRVNLNYDLVTVVSIILIFIVFFSFFMM